MGTGQHTLELSNLERREVQAPFMDCLLKGFIRELGREKAMQVASLSIQEDALLVGKTMAEKYGGNMIKELLRVIREVWSQDDALLFEIVEETDQKLFFNVTRCRYAEMYDRLGLKEYGYCLSCNRDESLIKGFNPQMTLSRTQTIMQGSESCDFRIVVE
jgi:hypothetical protein